MVKAGDIVGRKSYGCDVYFRVIDIDEDGTVCLAGVDYRIEADARPEDLQPISLSKLLDFKKLFMKDVDKKINNVILARRAEEGGQKQDESVLKRPGKALHIDGDPEYLKMCMKYYEKLGIEAVGELLPEKDQPTKVRELLEIHHPDIMIVTGHDALSKDQGAYTDLSKYRNSKYFVEAVKEARKYEPSMDSLVIFAGACQSFYEAIIKAGANFASSPNRIMIHALDPVLVAEKICYSSIEKVIRMEDILPHTISGIQGLGGLQTRGKYREGIPASMYKEKTQSAASI